MIKKYRKSLVDSLEAELKSFRIFLVLLWGKPCYFLKYSAEIVLVAVAHLNTDILNGKRTFFQEWFGKADLLLRDIVCKIKMVFLLKYFAYVLWGQI